MLEKHNFSRILAALEFHNAAVTEEDAFMFITCKYYAFYNLQCTSRKRCIGWYILCI